MKHLILITALMAPQAVTAQVDPPQSLLEQLEEMTKPLLPMLRGLGERIEELPNYYPPEVLPNGDIIIRRKPDVEPSTPLPDEAPPRVEPFEL